MTASAKRPTPITDTRGPRTIACEISPELHDAFARFADACGVTKAEAARRLVKIAVTWPQMTAMFMNHVSDVGRP